MGYKDWLVWYADAGVDAPALLRSRPPLDREATRALVERLHPGWQLKEIADGSLDDLNPPEGEVYAGCFPGLTIVCTHEIMADYTSFVERRLLPEWRGHTVYLHATHSVVDFFGYEIWAPDGTRIRALSVSPDDGIIENIGVPLPFEEPYWAGEHVLSEPYPLPFHPGDLGEEALETFLGLPYGDDDLDPAIIPLAGFAVRRPKRSRLPWRRRREP